MLTDVLLMLGEASGGRIELGVKIMPRGVLITFQLIIPIRVHSWRTKLIQHRHFVCLFIY